MFENLLIERDGMVAVGTVNRPQVVNALNHATRLPRLIGRGPAPERLLTGSAIPAERTLRLGLVSAVTAATGLRAAALAMGRTGAVLEKRAPVFTGRG